MPGKGSRGRATREVNRSSFAPSQRRPVHIDALSTLTLDAARWKPTLTPVTVPAANTDVRPTLAANGSPLIVNWDPLLSSTSPFVDAASETHISVEPTLAPKHTLASTLAPVLQPERVANKSTPHKGPLPQGASDTLKLYFDKVSQTPDLSAREMLARRVKVIPGIAHYTA
ncbi:hypothetical protein DICSQDRAFT_175010 [Dichomitus squalens LYAD-421 SS1]|uniref:Uncharacterized protein n=1 Tax=Dichomitus squalens (strain LYAD-421) TaxID=732165 RepID=R7SKE1_DICSQ|nr:uncharacterized protein DICSQDRAFT_175010 [Dichomitus squalens LYAD-421 SS1]EJF56328.1 hypothetical protein DICSQDRAFT_175010 [Dichomitus squalens LYAD-421 SS1]